MGLFSGGLVVFLQMGRKTFSGVCFVRKCGKKIKTKIWSHLTPTEISSPTSCSDGDYGVGAIGWWSEVVVVEVLRSWLWILYGVCSVTCGAGAWVWSVVDLLGKMVYAFKNVIYNI